MTVYKLTITKTLNTDSTQDWNVLDFAEENDGTFTGEQLQANFECGFVDTFDVLVDATWEMEEVTE